MQLLHKLINDWTVDTQPKPTAKKVQVTLGTILFVVNSFDMDTFLRGTATLLFDDPAKQGCTVVSLG